MNPTADIGGRGYAGLFLVTLATLMYEILLTRIFSATMWYHFAFVAISVAMFGMTVGAIVVYLAPGFFRPERAPRHLAASALLFGLSVVFCFLTQLCIPFAPDLSFVGIFSIGLTYLVVSVPFTFSGVCVCLALTKFPRRVSSLYAADLAGAAFGCIAVILVLGVTDALTAMFITAFFGTAGAWFFASDATERGRPCPQNQEEERGHPCPRKDASIALKRTALFLALALAAFSAAETALVRAQKPLIRLVWVNGYQEPPPAYEAWNSFSRIRVYEDDQTTTVKNVLIDTIAATPLTHFDGSFDRLYYLKYDIANLCHYLRPDSRVLVVGSGGGKDILSALVFKQRSVVGVEINAEILKLVTERYRDFTGRLDEHPKVELVHREGRSYVAGLDKKFDIIQISLIDTWAATAAGAFVLSENALYTVEAWTSFLEHLTPDGVLTLCRWYFLDRPGEMYRLTSLATAALRRIGVEDPRGHIVIVRSMEIGKMMGTADGLGTIFVSPSPFSPEDLATLESTARNFGFEIVLTPTDAMTPVFERIASGVDLEDFYDEFPINIAPPTDDRPFFFHMLRLRDVFKPERWDQGIVSFNMKAVVLLAGLLATVIVLTIACIIVPLVVASRSSRGGMFAGGDARAPVWSHLVFFGAIGLGFMLIEISQLQRLIIFLGHPTYGLTVVLFALLLSSGLGSRLTGNVDGAAVRSSGLRRLAALIGVLVLFGVLTPPAIHAFQGAATPVRITVGVALLFPIGLFMGMAFPLGMKRAAGRAETLTPWLWGINGATSVTASVLAVAIALGAGISATFWTGVLCYVVAALAFARRTPA